jgi:hypothetical protein
VALALQEPLLLVRFWLLRSAIRRLWLAWLKPAQYLAQQRWLCHLRGLLQKVEGAQRYQSDTSQDLSDQYLQSGEEVLEI